MCTYPCLLSWLLTLSQFGSSWNEYLYFKILFISKCRPRLTHNSWVYFFLFLSGTVMSSPQIGGAGKNAAQCNQLQAADSWKGRAVGNFLPPWSSVFAAIKCKYISSRQVGQRPSQDAAKPQLPGVRIKKSKICSFLVFLMPIGNLAFIVKAWI